MKRIASFLLVLLSVLWSCSSDEVRLADSGFFPVQIGFFQVYDVNEIIYTAFNPPQSLTYQLRVEVLDAFENQGGGLTYVTYRSKRETDSDPWDYLDTWSVRKTDQFALVAEGNTTYAKLVFPLRVNASWNGNQFNDEGEDEYTLEQYGGAFNAGNGISFSDVIVVNQNRESNLVFKDDRLEVYSFEKGLVYSEYQVWQYNCSGGTCTGQINNGKYRKMVLTDYGVE
ncbi:MAG: hypothetical protein KF803_14665 [Cyclobacteriaceae bacterium]|nr:hypothetical protein [Cyclobacteriaceae bacterium]